MFSRSLDDVLFAIYPVLGGNWMVGAMPPERRSFAQRLPLPAAWAGLKGEALVTASGIADAVFVHAKWFVASAVAGRRDGNGTAAIQASSDQPKVSDRAAGAGVREPISPIILRAQRAAPRERGYTDKAIRIMTPA